MDDMYIPKRATDGYRFHILDTDSDGAMYLKKSLPYVMIKFFYMYDILYP